MTTPTPLLSFDGDSIPSLLKANPRWAPWRAEWNAKRKKYDKIPHRADRPEFGLSTMRPERWASFTAALGAVSRSGGKFAGVGYCMTGAHGIVGVDLDACVENGQPAPWAAEVIARLGSYTERSPSGNGYRIMCLGAVPQDWNNHEVGIEVYGGNEARFLTVTGLHLAGTPRELQAIDPTVLEELARAYARERRKAEVIDLNIPDLLDELVLRPIDSLPLPERAEAFLLRGEFDGDRSGALHGAGVALYSAGLSDAEVFTTLANNPFALEVALDHRRQDHDRALLYLWREHCVKAKGKASTVASPDEFAVVAPAEDGRKPLPTFKRDKNGRIEATIENVALAVRRADLCGMDVRFDRFRDEIMYATKGNDWQPFRDADYSRLRIVLERAGFKAIGRELIRDVVLLVADENPFDSAITWLEGLPWDGVPRVETFLQQYFGADDSPYTRAVSFYLWSAMAGRVLEPGVKADMVPILIGGQGEFKSSTVAAMAPAPEFFTEVNFHEQDADLARKMRGRLLAEIGELRGLHTRDLESIKAFITRTHENWIPKYREFAAQFPRRLVFIGTTNKEEMLADDTGNRRWLPVRTGAADIEAVKRDRDQLWAEARELFKLFGVMFQGAETMGREVHKQHTITEPWTEEIANWLSTPDVLTGIEPQTREFLQVGEVAREALRIEIKHLGKREEMRICESLRACGFSRVQRQVNGKNAKVWAKGQPPVNHLVDEVG